MRWTSGGNIWIKAPDGRFAAEIARQMTAHLSKTPDRDDHRRLGIALATSGDADGAQVAIDHLRQAEFKQVWRVLGKTLLTTKQTEAGIAGLAKRPATEPYVRRRPSRD